MDIIVDFTQEGTELHAWT